MSTNEPTNNSFQRLAVQPSSREIDLKDWNLPIHSSFPELRSTPFYVTTPIYYPNAVPHIGHAYTTICADIFNRYYRLFGNETYFVTGTDEHGQKVQQAAEQRGMAPQAHVDELAQRFSEVWAEFAVRPDLFMRTTFNFHKKLVQESLQRLLDSGDIYKGRHVGWYSVSEEIFWPEKDIRDGKSPTGKVVIRLDEENYFFRMSRYQEQLIRHIETHPEFILPAEKVAETLGFLRQPLGDLCIGRPKSRVNWGIELPFDAAYVTYVWFDALLNYVSAIDNGNVRESARFQALWPQATHLIGKDILITHSVYWPTMLMALGMPLPRTIFAHGWWLNSEGRKMSKSEGDVVAPLNMKALFGQDAFRYYMARGLRFGNDLAFDIEKVRAKINDELAHNYGNLLSRSVKLAARLFNGKTPPGTMSVPASRVLATKAIGSAHSVYQSIERFDTEGAVGVVVDLLRATNKYFGDHEPWNKAKQENMGEVAEVLYSAMEAVRIASVLLHPVMPETTSKVLRLLAPHTPEPKLSDALSWGLLERDVPLDPNLPPLFNRV